MLAPKPLVHQSTTSTGPGALTLVLENGKQAFALAFGTGSTKNVFAYYASHRSAPEWEFGRGHMADATTFVRDTVIASSNANAAVDFTAGVKDIGNDFEPNSPREVLTAARFYYVRPDGNDAANDGLTNTAGGAFATIAKALAVIATLDLGVSAAVVQLGTPGTYAGATVSTPFVGGPGSGVYVIGDVGAPGDYVLSSQIGATSNAKIIVRGVDFTSSNRGVYAADGGVIQIDGVVIFGACAIAHAEANRGGQVLMNSAYTIDGGAPQHLLAQHSGFVFSAGLTVTLTGTPNFTSQFVQVAGGTVQANSNTYNGPATGQRFFITLGGAIQTLGASLESYFPGSIAGQNVGGFHDMSPSPTYREVLTSPRTLFVRGDGNDNNSGLVNSAGGALRNVQTAIDRIASIDTAVYNVIINVGPGTWSPVITLKSILGAGSVTLRGDTTAPSNVVTTGGITSTNVVGSWIIEGFKFQVPGTALNISGPGSTASFGSCEFGACGHHIRAGNGAHLFCHANYSISGGAGFHWINSNAIMEITGKTITLGGNPAFANAFFLNEGPCYSRMFGNTFNGGATGTRYITDEQGVCQTNGAGVNYFPGTIAGGETNVCDTYK